MVRVLEPVLARVLVHVAGVRVRVRATAVLGATATTRARGPTSRAAWTCTRCNSSRRS